MPQTVQVKEETVVNTTSETEDNTQEIKTFMQSLETTMIGEEELEMPELPDEANQKVLVDRKYAIPVAGIEAVPLGVLASVDLNGNGAEAAFLETTIESTLGGVLLYAAYQSVLTMLKSETARRDGDITRLQQVKLVATTALDAGRSSAFTMLIASAIVAIMPWLTWPLAALGIVGAGFMSKRVAEEFWMALTPDQQSELKTAADKAKVNLEKMIPTNETIVTAPAAA